MLPSTQRRFARAAQRPHQLCKTEGSKYTANTHQPTFTEACHPAPSRIHGQNPKLHLPIAPLQPPPPPPTPQSLRPRPLRPGWAHQQPVIPNRLRHMIPRHQRVRLPDRTPRPELLLLVDEVLVAPGQQLRRGHARARDWAREGAGALVWAYARAGAGGLADESGGACGGGHGDGDARR